MTMRVLIGCERSGVMRRAFRARGFDAWSCDTKASRDDSPYHIQDDLLNHLNDGWDLLISHPECTHLAVSGARWFPDKQDEQAAALDFVRKLMAAPVKHKALENPVSIISSRIRPASQYVQLYWFGHPEFKKTGWWLDNLPKLTPTCMLTPPLRDTDEWKVWNKVHREPPSPDRAERRSETRPGMAEACAQQWGDYILKGKS
jgi:hypothetical protein